MPAFFAWPVLKAFFGGALSSVWSAIRSFFGSLNAQGWIGLIASACLAALWLHTAGEARHWKKQSDRFEKLYNADEAAAKKVAAHALALKAQIDSLSANISQALKDKHDAESSRIHADADAVRLRGPGKAACAGNPGIPAAAGGSQQPNGTRNASVGPVPSGEGIDLIGLPFAPAIDFAESHDQLRSEVLTWREWYRQLVAAWPQRLTTSAPATVQKK